MSLLEKLEGAGLDVWAHPTWETNTNNGRDRAETVGILNHWDAISGWPGDSKYLSNNRFGGILYHCVIKRDGQVRLYSQRYVWHAGSGSSQILAIAQRAGTIPDDSAGPDNQNGNPHFFGVCINYHPNQGPVPAAQYQALVQVNAVLIDHFGLNVGQIARHLDWTTRKRDIDTIDLATFRDDVKLALNPDMTLTQIRIELAAGWHSRTGEWMSAAGGETRQQRLTRIAGEIHSGQRTFDDVWQHLPNPGPQDNDPVPAWVLDPFASSVSPPIDHHHDGRYLKDVKLER